MPVIHTRRFILQKARRHPRGCKHPLELRLLVGTRFQVLFHSAPAVLFTVPSRYYPLSVAREYLALGGGPPRFPRGSSCPAVLGNINHRALCISHTGLSPSLAGLSMPFCYPQGFLLCEGIAVPSVHVPLPPDCNGCNLSHNLGLGSSAFARHYLRNHLLSSLPRGTEMFQFPRLPPYTYAFSVQSSPMTVRGFPHSDIHTSTLAYSSVWHFGVRPVLRRLLAPRHPPCAFLTFTCDESSPDAVFRYPCNRKALASPSLVDYLRRSLSSHSLSSFQGTSSTLAPMHPSMPTHRVKRPTLPIHTGKPDREFASASPAVGSPTASRPSLPQN